MSRTPGMHEVRVRARKAPATIHTAKEALEAFKRLNTYRDAAREAHIKANWYTPGTYSFHLHLERESAYDDVADGWENALGYWLRVQAGADQADDRA